MKSKYTFYIKEPTIKDITIQDSKEVYEEFKEIRNMDQESVWLLGMNSKNSIILKECVHLGGIDTSVIDPKLIFRRLLKAGCISFILIHNHPSGSLIPSREDNSITKRLNEISKIVGISMLDHIIVGDGYYSYANENDLIRM